MTLLWVIVWWISGAPAVVGAWTTFLVIAAIVDASNLNR